MKTLITILVNAIFAAIWGVCKLWMLLKDKIIDPIKIKIKFIKEVCEVYRHNFCGWEVAVTYVGAKWYKEKYGKDILDD